MNVPKLKKTVVADRSVAHFCQVVCSIVAGVVLVFGIRRLAELDLGEPELFSAINSTVTLAGIFIVLGFQCRAWSRAG